MKKRLLSVMVGLMALMTTEHTQGAVPIKTQPASLTVNAGSTARFSVSVTNALGLRCQWQFNGADIAGETNLVLTVENVRSNQAGSYSAVLSGDSGSLASSASKLTVLQGTIVRFGMASGNIDVQLFDHDKPVTVQNFLHYVGAGIYTNTFFHRLEPGFVLQGGGFGTTNRGSSLFRSNPIVDLHTLAYRYSGQSFAFTIVNQFSSGPIIPNKFGTLAMARTSDANEVVATNSASSQWFFNLADNSTNLDNVSGGFTVFGRVIAGEQALRGFNTFSPGNGIVNPTTNANSVFANMPVLLPCDESPSISNLYFANISLLSKPKLDRTAPSVKVTYPKPNAHLTNGHFVMRGSASDSVGLGMVECHLWRADRFFSDSLALDDWNDWSAELDLPPNAYMADFRAWDGYGNLTRVQVPFWVEARLSTQVIGPGRIASDLNGKYLEPYKSYTMTAVPASGQILAEWSGPGIHSTSTKLSFFVSTNSLITARFVSNWFPQVTGAYIGLFGPATNAAPTNSGSFSLKLGTSGAYSGKIQLAGKATAFTGQFDYLGNSCVSQKLTGTTNTVNIVLSISPTNSAAITGTVSNSQWTAEVLAYRAATKIPSPLVSGRYVLTLAADTGATDEHEGDGYLVLKLSSSGVIAASGKLGDGSSFTATGIVSEQGDWALYSPLYKNRGVLLGWPSLSITNAVGLARWIAPGGSSNKISTVLQVRGGAYAAPELGANYRIELEGGGLSAPVSGTISANTSKVIISEPLGSQLTLSLAAATGVLSGKLVTTGETMGVGGAFVNPVIGGAGYFTNGAGVSGRFTIKP